ncbi:MAG: putative amino acid racemase [Clostridia bacterium]|jgi:predicted amino acid racemase|nr:putative amino acid racemase [Clostridia bacterium]
MFLETLMSRNQELIECAFKLQQQQKIEPDTYVLDLDAIIENAKQLKQEADKYHIDLFFMTKQIGRNPYVCKRLVELGYSGAVVVDFREARVMMKNNIPIAHAGHLVQIPDGMIQGLIEYGVEYLTIYSIEKANQVNDVCRKLGKQQKIYLKVVSKEDYVYPGQESGVEIDQLEKVISELKTLKYLEIAGITAFPCFLYDESEEEVLPVSNMYTLIDAKKRIESLLGKKIQVNMPSCTQKQLIQKISEHGGTQGEPGNSLTGTIPNNRLGKASEMPAIAYVTEVSHQFRGKTYCYGGGVYTRGKMDNALVGTCRADAKLVKVEQPNCENIDYYIPLLNDAQVGSGVVMSFRTQIFVTRSHVALVEGISKKSPRLIGIYDAQGQLISELKG